MVIEKKEEKRGEVKLKIVRPGGGLWIHSMNLSLRKQVKLQVI